MTPSLIQATTPTRPVSLATVLAALLSATVAATAVSAQQSSAPLRGARPIVLEQNGAELELSSLAGIRVTKNGGVLFADNKPVTVRVRSGANGSIRQTARAGAGPGEFRASPEFVGFGTDSIAAFDASLRRWSVLSPTGEFVRVLATGPEAEPLSTAAAWVGERALVYNAAINGVRAPLATVVSAIAVDAAKSFGRVGLPVVIRQTNNGDLWVAPAFASISWRVFDRAGRPRFAAAFPRPFDFQFANDTVAVGRSTDEDELPQIHALSLVRAPVAQGAASVSAPKATGTIDPVVRKNLVALLKQLVGKQEMAYSDSSSYTTSLARLRIELPGTMQLVILDANNRGWVAMAVDTTTGATCALGIGARVIVGWNEAVPYCSP